MKKHILLGITGGVAAYKSAELTRLLVKAGYDVQVVMSQAATCFVQPATFQALSGRPVFCDLWDARIDNHMAHIELSRHADLIVVAPATADFLFKLAHGVADDLLSALCCARQIPLWLAPAMNRQMWQNPPNQRNVAQLREDGVVIHGPDEGDQACGETGMGRMLEAMTLFNLIQQNSCSQPGDNTLASLKGIQILITAGPTVEQIDPVRALTNHSSGKMGFALAQAANQAGAEVTLIAGPSALNTPDNVRRINVTSAAEMHQAVMVAVPSAQIFISAAAVADYTIDKPSTQKIKKAKPRLTLELVATQDILAAVAALAAPPFCVGFAAESENILSNAEDKRLRKKIPLIVANSTDAIGTDDNQVTLIDKHGQHAIPRASKPLIARTILQHIAKLYRESMLTLRDA